jgi:hypothetical protein
MNPEDHINQDDFIKLIKKKKVVELKEKQPKIKQKLDIHKQEIQQKLDIHKQPKQKIVKRYKKLKILNIDDILKLMNNSYVKKIYTKKKLDTIEEELPIKKDYSLQLKQLDEYYHTVSFGNNFYNKQWRFIKNNEKIILTFKSIDNKNNIQIPDSWYFTNLLKNYSTNIYNITEFINENLKYFKEYNYNKTLFNNLIDEIDNFDIFNDKYKFITSTDIGYSIYQGNKKDNDYQQFLKIVINKYNFNITLFFNNETKIIDNEFLLKFIKDNLENIKLLKNKSEIFNSIKYNSKQDKLLQNKIENDVLNKLNNLKLEEKINKHNNSKLKPCNFFYEQSKKQLIETISCKKYIEKEYWET